MTTDAKCRRPKDVRTGDGRWTAVLLAALVCLSAVAGTTEAAPLGKRIALENGMVLLLAERHELPVVTVNMAIRAGSMEDPSGKPGLSALTASLLTQGTERRTASQISEAIDAVGGSLGVSGGNDFVTARLKVLKKDVRTGFELLADVLMHPVFAQQEIDRKVKETLASIRQSKDDPETIAGDAFSKAVFGNHPYGLVNDDVAAFLPKMTRQDIVSLYQHRYGPNNCIISVAGDITETEALALIREHFNGWKAADAASGERPRPPAIKRTKVIKLDKNITQANIAMGQLGVRREDPDYYAVTVMNYILGGGGFSSRLMDNIRDNRGLAYDVNSQFIAQKDPGSFRVWTQTKSGTANEAIAEIYKELKRIQKEPVSARELDDAKAYLTGSFPLRMDTLDKIAGTLTAIEIYNLGLDYPDRYPRLINAVTAKDVLRVARKHIDPDRMVIVVLGDQKKIHLKYK